MTSGPKIALAFLTCLNVLENHPHISRARRGRERGLGNGKTLSCWVRWDPLPLFPWGEEATVETPSFQERNWQMNFQTSYELAHAFWKTVESCLTILHSQILHPLQNPPGTGSEVPQPPE